MSIEIKITVPTNPEFWGSHVTRREANAAVHLHLTRLVDWAADHWAGASVDGTALPDTTPSNAQTTAYDADGERLDIVEAINQRAQDTWLNDFSAANI